VSYAAAGFESWHQGDAAGVRELSAGAVTDVLTARAPGDPVGWHDPVCDGAAGSTYCRWDRADAALVLRVANAPASEGAAHAVTSAQFAVPAGGVAVWPLTTAEEAANTQASVDAGHSPWMLDPVAVAASYAQAELGWIDAEVETVRPGTYPVIDPAAGARAEIAIAQPARQGDGGIWAVAQAGSVALG
jgi:hypothetical protein